MLQPFDAGQDGLRWIFIGPDGLRAPWSLVIFAGLVVPLDFILGFLTHKFPALFAAALTPGASLLLETLELTYVALAIAIAGRLERRAVWSYCRLTADRPAARLVAGFVAGLACLSLVAGVLHAAGFLRFDGVALRGPAIVGYGLIWLLDFLMVGLREEVMYRGYLQATFARGIGFWPAAIVVSALFGAGHIANAGESLIGVTGVVVRALFYCLLLRLTGSLWVGIGFHAAWDWAQSYLYGTPQSGHVMAGHLFATHPVGQALWSGGAVGPEGSLLWAAPFAICALVFVWALRRLGLLQRRIAGGRAPRAGRGVG